VVSLPGRGPGDSRPTETRTQQPGRPGLSGVLKSWCWGESSPVQLSPSTDNDNDDGWSGVERGEWREESGEEGCRLTERPVDQWRRWRGGGGTMEREERRERQRRGSTLTAQSPLKQREGSSPSMYGTSPTAVEEHRQSSRLTHTSISLALGLGLRAQRGKAL
jgi:hypothetical protein